MSFKMFACSAALFLLSGAIPAAAQVKIGVVTSATGPTAMVGIPQKNTVPLLPTKIGDLSVEYISLDDVSDPTQTVIAFKKLISEEKVDAFIGPTGSPNAMGIIQFVAESGTPMLRSEEHTSELQSLMRISYAVFCLNKKMKTT